MKKVCFTTTIKFWGKQQRQRINSLKEFYSKKGWDTCWSNPDAPDLDRQLQGCSHVYMWNGSDNTSRPIYWKSKAVGARVFSVENGHFPQSKYNICAEEGLYGRHPAQKMDWDRLLDQEDWDKFQQKRNEMVFWRNPIRDVIVPLQVDDDVTVLKYGNAYTNEDLLRCDLGGDKWVRNHPKGKRYRNDGHTDDRPNLDQVLGSYDRAFGINSTVLYQAKLMGLEVSALGQSYLEWHPDPDVSMCALLAMQIPTDTNDFTPWMKKGRGLEHLSDVI